MVTKRIRVLLSAIVMNSQIVDTVYILFNSVLSAHQLELFVIPFLRVTFSLSFLVTMKIEINPRINISVVTIRGIIDFRGNRFAWVIDSYDKKRIFNDTFTL